jgi:hypothetical protein
MKRFGGLISITLILLQFGFLPLTPRVEAAGCSNVSSFGAVRLYLPDVPTDVNYGLWVRMQASEPEAKVMIEVNQTNCFEITASNFTAGQWYWQSYQVDGAMQPLKFNDVSGNTLRIIGIQAGVKVDKILLAEPSCIPQEFGTNCKNSVEAIGLPNQEVTVLLPPSDEPISGKVSLSVTPQKYGSQLQRLKYVVSSRTVQASDKNVPFDTTLVTNGKHTVLIETTLKDGSIINESTVIEINNPENALSPVIRWIRLNSRPISLTGLSIAGIIVMLLVIGGLRGWYLKRRQLHFHGF